MQIADKLFLVTGAGSGLGEAVARRLSAMGGNVCIADINEDGGNRVAADLGDSAIFCKTDVSDEASVNECIEAATAQFGALSGVVHCAGVGGAKRLVGRDGPHDLASFQRIVNINLIGTFNIARLTANVMQNNEPGESGERGVIVNTASVAAFDGQIGQAAYSASKAGVAAMTLPLARELAKLGIRIMTVAPGLFRTPLMDELPEEVQTALGASVPFPSRLGHPDEFAMLAQQIIENQMLNGEVIRLDGAIRMAAK
jgi:NAD(P)-dependent dehydrogenase (short-subunit alcohol dehydrogenase family)